MSLSLADRTPLAAKCQAVNAKFLHLSDLAKVVLIILFDGLTLVAIGVMVVLLPVLAVSIITTVVSILVKVMGQPAQIRKLWLAKSAKELSFTNAAINQLSYGCWVAFAVKTHNLTVLLAQGAGIIGTTIIVTLILGFTLRPPMTSFGHPRTKHCKICWEWLGDQVVYFAWPFPCFGCSNGRLHIVGIRNSGRVTAKCDICHRKAYVEITGPRANPDWWQGLVFLLRKNVIGSSYLPVTMAQYLEAEKLYLRELIHPPSGGFAIRV